MAQKRIALNIEDHLARTEGSRIEAELMEIEGISAAVINAKVKHELLVGYDDTLISPAEVRGLVDRIAALETNQDEKMD